MVVVLDWSRSCWVSGTSECCHFTLLIKTLSTANQILSGFDAGYSRRYCVRDLPAVGIIYSTSTTKRPRSSETSTRIIAACFSVYEVPAETIIISRTLESSIRYCPPRRHQLQAVSYYDTVRDLKWKGRQKASVLCIAQFETLFLAITVPWPGENSVVCCPKSSCH